MAFTKEEAATVKAAAELIKREITAGEKVDVFKFGSFKPKTTKARTGRNPATGEALQIDAKNTVGFHPSKAWTGSL